MDTVDRGNFKALQMPRYNLIRQDHEFFNDAVREVTDGFHDSCNVALVVVGQNRFR